jgi:hypothetical protein
MGGGDGLLINNLLKITVFWDMTPSSLGDVYRHSGECTASIFRAEVGGIIFLLNAGTHNMTHISHGHCHENLKSQYILSVNVYTVKEMNTAKTFQLLHCRKNNF